MNEPSGKKPAREPSGQPEANRATCANGHETARATAAPDEQKTRGLAALFYDPQTITAIAAVFIAACALVVSVYEARVTRSEQRAAVWPYVDMKANYNASGFQLLASNKGVGPARVQSVRVIRGGTTVLRDWQAVVDDLMGPESGLTYATYRSNAINGAVMSPEEEVLLFGVPWNDTTRTFVERFERTDLAMEVCYCSVMGACWTARFQTEVRTQTDGCAPVRPDEQFE